MQILATKLLYNYVVLNFHFLYYFIILFLTFKLALDFEEFSSSTVKKNHIGLGRSFTTDRQTNILLVLYNQGLMMHVCVDEINMTKHG